MAEETVTMEALQLLIAQKDAIEAELVSTRAWLTAPGNLGLSGGLLDEEGFPINDVEKIIATRDARGKVARLQNDHLDIMKKIEYGIYAFHLKARQEGTVTTIPFEPKGPISSPAPTADSLAAKYEHLSPFALVNSVSQLSPAFKADLREGDKILMFGTAESSNGGFSKIKENVNEDKEITTVVKRHNEDGSTSIKELQLKPSKWAGPGLLGCHLLPFTL